MTNHKDSTSEDIISRAKAGLVRAKDRRARASATTPDDHIYRIKEREIK